MQFSLYIKYHNFNQVLKFQKKLTKKGTQIFFAKHDAQINDLKFVICTSCFYYSKHLLIDFIFNNSYLTYC